MEHKSYYAVIPANVRYDPDLSPNSKLLYGEITALCNECGYCWASNSYFAELYGVSKRTVIDWLNLLLNRGYIKSRVEYKNGSKEIAKRYIQICDTPGEENFTTYRKKSHYPGEENFTTPGEENFTDNNTVINNTINNKRIYKKDDIQPIIDDYSDNEKVKELLNEWLEVRKKKRAANTPGAIKRNIDKLDKIAKDSGMTVEEYLDEVIRRGWAAFYTINDFGNKKPKFVNEDADEEYRAIFK